MSSLTKRKINKKMSIVIICVTLVVCIAAGSTLAYLVTNTEALMNIFSPSHVSVTVNETSVENTGETAAYLRLLAVVTLQSTTNPDIYYGGDIFVYNEDYTATAAANGWTLNEDGYYYFPTAVEPGESVTIPQLNVTLSDSFTVPAGYQVSVQYLVTAIQAWPSNAVTNAWGGTVSNGTYIPSNPQ